MTRFMAIFHTNAPERVGPVRSARVVDADLVAPLDGLFAHSGAAPSVLRAIRAAGTAEEVSHNTASSAYRRDGSRKAPSNLYLSAPTVFDGRDGAPPKPLFRYVAADADPSADGEAATGASFSFASKGAGITYTYDADAKVYRRMNGAEDATVEGDGRIGPANVLIQMVRLTSGRTIDAAGQRTQDSHVIGNGDAILLRGGRVIRGTWSRATRDATTTYEDASGKPMLLAPGATWIALVPNGRTVDVSTPDAT